MTSAESSSRPLRDRLGETILAWRARIAGSGGADWSRLPETIRENYRCEVDTLVTMAAERGVRIEVGEEKK